MHTGEPCGKQGIAYVYVGQPLIVAVSRNHPLLNGVTNLFLLFASDPLLSNDHTHATVG